MAPYTNPYHLRVEYDMQPPLSTYTHTHTHIHLYAQSQTITMVRKLACYNKTVMLREKQSKSNYVIEFPLNTLL